jgi:hypothetical protein
MPDKRRKTRKAPHRQSLRIQTLWAGSPLSRMERAALQSYVNQGYTVDIYTYNPIAEFKKRVPFSPNIHIRDAREILDESALFEYKGRVDIGARNDAFKFLPFSDLFRFTMLHKRGGAWMDLDILLTRPIPAAIANRPYFFSSERTIQKGAYKKKEKEVASVSVMKVPGPGSALTTWLLEHIPKGGLDPKTPFDYMNLFRKALIALDLEKYVLPAPAFTPLNWWDVKESFAKGAGLPGACYPPKYGVRAFCVSELKRADVYGVHWFRAILRKKGLPYEEVTDSDSLYESMLATIENDGGLARGTI